MKRLNTSGISHLLIPVVVFVLMGAIGGTYLLLQSKAATPDSTTTTTAPTSSVVATGIQLCMNANTNLCISTHGPGNSATVQGSNYASWTKHSTRFAGYYMFSNGANNCLLATGGSSGGPVTVSSSGCDQNNNRELWIQRGSGPFSFKNNYTQDFLGTWGPSAGNTVYNRQNQGNFYTGWLFR